MSHDGRVPQPYSVGKGKPPKEHQFKKGEPSPNPHGRPKGSTRQSQLQKMLKKKVWVTGPDGRRVRKPLQEIIDHRLIEAAAGGDLKAIKLVNELVIMHERFQTRRPPSPEEVREQIEQEEKQRKINDDFNQLIINHLEFLKELKRCGILEGDEEGNPGLSSWVWKASAERHPDLYRARDFLSPEEHAAALARAQKQPVEKPGG